MITSVIVYRELLDFVESEVAISAGRWEDGRRTATILGWSN